jgi:glycosyltransferase involved in cell wall biosynthesis
LEKPLVSIVIPTYNRAEYLKQAIESVLAQTYTNLELLILDNCSQDNTPEIVAKFTDPRIKYLRHQCNIRGLANWTYGVFWASGEYLSILCDDDIFLPDFVLDRVAEFSQDQSIISVFGEMSYWNGDSREFANEKKDIDSKIFQGADALKIVLDKQLLITSMFKRDILQTVWEKVIRGGKTMDILLVGLLAKEPGTKIAYLRNLKDSLYRIHHNQDSRENMMLVAEDGGRMFEIMLENSTRIERKIIRRKIIQHWNRNGRILWDLNKIDDASVCFIKELSINPLKIVTWLRYLRCMYYKFKKM